MRERDLLKRFHYKQTKYIIYYIIDIRGKESLLAITFSYFSFQMCKECCKTDRCNSGKLNGMKNNAYVIKFSVFLLTTTASLSLVVNSLL